MKTIKILIPAALTFVMSIAVSGSANAQSDYNMISDNPVYKATNTVIPTKTIGLNYLTTLKQINTALTQGVKADHSIDFQGKVIVQLDLDKTGKINNISFDKDLSPRLRTSIETALYTTTLDPVLLNGKAKAQTFKIPVIIK